MTLRARNGSRDTVTEQNESLPEVTDAAAGVTDTAVRRGDALLLTGKNALPYRKFPCGPCPIRADNHDNPEAKFSADRWEDLSCTVRDPETGLEPSIVEPMFGCHKGRPSTGEDLACAGWLVTFGHDHLAVRVALATGELPEDALEAGDDWPSMHKTWEDVVRAQSSS